MIRIVVRPRIHNCPGIALDGSHLSSVRAAVREEVRIAVAAQVTGAPGLLQPPQSSSENPVAGSSGEFCRTRLLVFVGQIVIIHWRLVRATLE